MEDQKKYWGDVAKLGSLASVIDPNDQRGHKNRYIVGIRDRALNERLPRGDAAILDFGCGSGNLAAAMASHQRHFTGIDITPELVALAREQNNPDYTNFLLYDGGSIPLPDDSFDAATTYVVLNHITDDAQLVASLREVVRVLRPGTSMYCVEQTRRHTTVTEQGLKKQRSVADFEALFVEAGFRVSRVEHLRKARYPGIYLIRYGLIPAFMYQALAWVDGCLATLFNEPRTSYVDTLFTLDVPQS